jgi:hypothetical protein
MDGDDRSSQDAVGRGPVGFGLNLGAPLAEPSLGSSCYTFSGQGSEA